MDTEPNLSSREDRVNAAIAAFLEAAEAGQAPDRKAFIAAHPDIASELEKFFADRDQFERLARPLGPSSAVPPANAVEAPTQPLSSTAAAAAPGDRVRYFGDYELLEEIARGGMGVVYKARQVSLNRIVALKMILAGQLASEADVHRFRTEAEAAANLDHPNIVPIYEVGEYEGQHYFSMKLIEGGSLARSMASGQWPVALKETQRRAARLLADVAIAVHHAHQRGILHRDLKPSNILLDANGEPRITDFGLAKRIQADSRFTQSGVIVGTPSYMSPEQARSEKVLTTAVDVYSMGAILYELLTGRPPFQAPTPLDTLLRVMDQEPIAPRKLNLQLHRDLETACMKAMAKEPARRYATAADLSADLHRYLEGKPIQARPVGQAERFWRWCKRNPALAAACGLALTSLVAVSIVSTLFAFHSNRAAEKESRAAENLRQEHGKTEAALDEAKTERRQAEERLVQLYVSNGVRLMAEGDLFGSLPWFLKALEGEKGGPKREAVHRMRMGAVLGLCPRLVQLWVHEGQVTDAEFSPDGHRVVTACSDGTVQVWDTASGKPVTQSMKAGGWVLHASFSHDDLQLLTVTRDQVQVWNASTGLTNTPPVIDNHSNFESANFSPDGRWLVIASGDKTAQVWDPSARRPITPSLRHDNRVMSAAFSPDGRLVATCSADHTARVWDAAKGGPVTPRLQHKGWVTHVAFSPDGRQVVTASGDNTARVWDATTGQPVTPPLQHKGWVTHVAFSPNGHRVVTASYDQTARVWDAANGQAITPQLKHQGVVTYAAFSSDGLKVVTASRDQTARVWDAVTGEELIAPMKHNGRVYHVAFSPNGHQVLTASMDQTARLWDVSSAQPVTTLKLDASVRDAAFSPDGLQIVTASDDGTARVWETASGRAVSPPMKHNGAVMHAVFSPDGRRIVTSSYDRTARIWDALSGLPITAPLTHQSFVWHASFSPDGRWVVTAGDDARARVWDAANSQPVTPFMRHNAAVGHAAFSPDGRWVVTANYDNMARVWNATNGKLVASPLKHKKAVLHAAFSPDSGRVVTASDDGTARVWDAANGQPVTPPLKHNGGVSHAVFSPDGRKVVTASNDQTARIWDASSGQPLTPPLKHNGVVEDASFSPDGRWVVTASDDQTARLWDAASGQPITPPLRHNGLVSHVSFSPDGQQVVTASNDQTARVWKLPADERPIEDWRLFVELLSGTRMNAQGTFTPLPALELAQIWRTLRAKYRNDFAISHEE
jgi:WD40 repeat protein/tRNA A-37 threonylcarbamoyl transferase component Bud32